MKLSITLGATTVAFASFATSCTTVAPPPAGSGMTYLVGVAGGG